jgi:hypothetical protein
LPENTLSSSEGQFSLVDMCDAHKFYEVEQRVLVFYKYSNEARDCVKVKFSLLFIGGQTFQPKNFGVLALALGIKMFGFWVWVLGFGCGYWVLGMGIGFGYKNFLGVNVC